jgi:hypothetical protein
LDTERLKKMCFVFLFLQEIKPGIGEALCSLWDKIPPFVPKSTFFDSPTTFHETPESATSSKYVGYRGRPIRGYSHMEYGPGYQNYGVNYGHRANIQSKNR